MDDKTLTVLEYPKIIDRLAEYAAFSASADLAHALRPSSSLEEILEYQAHTTEARLLLSINVDLTVGGVHDIRPQVVLASRGGVLSPHDLLDIKDTLASARNLGRTFGSTTSAQPSYILKKKFLAGKKQFTQEMDDQAQESKYPHLAAIASKFVPPAGLIDAISRAISENSEIYDNASLQLASIRRELKISHERLISRMERLVSSPKIAPMLQESIITLRNGRYVIPLRAEFKGRIRSMIHDQSASGATLFVEPLVMVELNNQWHELQLAERDEERRILADLSSQVGTHVAILDQIVAGLAELDLALMFAKYAEDLHASAPVLLPSGIPTDNHPGSTVRLFQARHPLLNPDTVVPVDIEMDGQTFAIVITGPNTGGKTVTLKTMGLLVLMAQSGFHIPALSGSTLSIFNEVYADIGDEQSIEQSLSTFSGHIQNIIHILSQADTTSLVLLDELGAGTDPQEGAALARAILADLVKWRITCMVATHYPELKIYAHAAPGVTNACMEFDIQTLRPTFHLTIGLPGRSNALLIAERLGLDGAIIQDARSTLDPSGLRADDLLDDIRKQRDKAHRARIDAEQNRREVEKMQKELSRRLDHIDDERATLLEAAHAQADEEISRLQAEIAELRRSLARSRQSGEPLKELKEKELKEIEEQVEELQVEIEKRSVRRKKRTKTQPERPWKVGNRAWVRSLKMEGVLASIDGEDVEVQLGSLRMRTRLDDIRHPDESIEEAPVEPAAPKPVQKNVEEPSKNISVFHVSPGMELDLRGLRADEALDRVERHLESAYLAGMPFVRIIHGKGTGRLREVVRQALEQNSHVTSFEAGNENEGGMGVTVVHLASE